MAFIIAAVLGVIALAWFLRRLFPALFAAVFVLFAPVWLVGGALLDLLRRQLQGARVVAFDFKALRPTFDLHPFSVHGKPREDGRTIDLWAQDHEGLLTMHATATVA